MDEDISHFELAKNSFIMLLQKKMAKCKRMGYEDEARAIMSIIFEYQKDLETNPKALIDCCEKLRKSGLRL